MIKKSLQFQKQAQESLIRGVDILANAVGATLGPKGMNVAFDRGYLEPKVVHDGVSVAKEIYLEDPFENMGAQLVRGAATRTNEVGGDGTTTATVLARALVKAGFRQIQDGKNRADLISEIGSTVKKFDKELQKMATKVTSTRQIEEVARISAQNKQIGDIVAEVVNAVGEDGVVTVEEGSQLETSFSLTRGMEFDRGYISSGFLTSEDDATVSSPHILVYDGRIADEDEMHSFLSNIVQHTKNVVVIANHVEGYALRFLVANKLKGVINTIAIRAPGFGEGTKKHLADIAALTGATLITDDSGVSLANVTLDMLGRADKVISTEKTTKIIGGKGKAKQVAAREKVIRRELSEAPDDWHRDQIQKRLARFVGSVAVIRAGGATEIEMGETKERIIDAVGATQAALEEGVVQGGETAIMLAARSVFGYPMNDARAAKMSAGEMVVLEAVCSPWETLLKNAAFDPEKIDFPRNLRGRVFDVNMGKWRSATKSGIIDPVKVTRHALINAASVACSILSTGVTITTKEEPHVQA